MLGRLGVVAEQALMVGDSESCDVLGPRELGMPHAGDADVASIDELDL